MGRSKSPRWRRVAALSVALISMSILIGGYPLAKLAWSDHRAEKIRLRYAAGLSPCAPSVVAFLDEFDTQLRKASRSDPRIDLSSRADVSITIFPSFSEPESARIVDEKLTYFRLLPKNNRDDSRAGHEIRIDTVRNTRLSPSVAHAIRETLMADITHAYAEPALGLDGATYYFRTMDGRCAEAWSPDPKRRAGMWASVFHALSEWTRPGAKAEDEADVRRSINALRAE
jgi:hypothetical protein